MNPWFEQEYVKALKELAEPREYVILNGVTSHEEYLKAVEFRKGLLAALEVFKSLVNHMEQIE